MAFHQVLYTTSSNVNLSFFFLIILFTNFSLPRQCTSSRSYTLYMLNLNREYPKKSPQGTKYICCKANNNIIKEYERAKGLTDA